MNINDNYKKYREDTINIEGIPYPIYDGGLRFFEQTRRIKKWPINNGDLVVDVGCGHLPFPYATILLDKDMKDGKERFYFPIPHDERQLIEADIEQGLPFKNKEIDFLYCSHTLEHCNDPGFVISEIERVAKRGFIETPNLIFEILFGGNDDTHKWVTDYCEDSDVLNFRKLKRKELSAIKRRKELGNVIYKLFKDNEKPFRLHLTAYWKNQDVFTECFLWEDKINFNVVKEGVLSY